MGLLTDYFVAPSDAAAASTLDRVRGPRSVTDARPTTRWSGLFRRSSGGASIEEPLYPTVSVNGIDPVVQMGTLESLLTGRTFESILDSSGDPVIASQDGGERLVVRLTSTLTDALASASMPRLVEVAVPWSHTEEFSGQGEPTVLAGFLRELAGLAQHARDTDQQVYCWLSV